MSMVTYPALCDTHVHLRDPGLTYKEDIETGAKAAKRGGFGSIIAMGNTKPPVDNVEMLRYVLGKGRDLPGIDIYSVANITRGMQGKGLTDMESLAEAGAIAFSDDGKPVLDRDLLEEAMRRAAALHKPVCLHEEDPAFIRNNGINTDIASKLGIEGSDRRAEISLVARDIELAKRTGCTVVFQHISCMESVELLAEARRNYANIHAEATPHHFSLTEDSVLACGSLAKVNPPLRSAEDRDAIREGLRSGALDIIASDHAPHSKEEKDLPITKAPSGMIGLQTALALGITNLVRTGVLTLRELMALMSDNPKRIYGITDDKTFTFDPDVPWVFTEDLIASKSHNSPFIGETLYGKIAAV